MILAIKILAIILPMMLGDHPTQTDQATLIIYQGGGYSTQSFDIYLNDKPLISPMRKNTSVIVKVEEGEIELKTVGKRYLLETNDYLLEVKSGNTYYLKGSLVYNFPLTGFKLSISNYENYSQLATKLKKVTIGEKVQDISNQ